MLLMCLMYADRLQKKNKQHTEDFGMLKKEYRDLADVIRNSNRDDATKLSMAKVVAELYTSLNPKFDKHLFYARAGVQAAKQAEDDAARVASKPLLDEFLGKSK